MVADTAQRIKDELHRVIVGKDELIETLFSCLLAEGHILVEGNPGLAKTTITKLFAQTLGCTFNRQQFTPDLLPADITGSYVFDQKTGEFYVRKGGIFANIVMVDELNRATPRTQSALLEAMEERNVTIEGTTFPLEKPFMVLATQTRSRCRRSATPSQGSREQSAGRTPISTLLQFKTGSTSLRTATPRRP